MQKKHDSQPCIKKNKICVKKEKKETPHFEKKMFDLCNFGWALLIGAFVFMILFGGRRAHNRHKRRNHTKDRDDGKISNSDVRSGDVSNDVPEHLDWSLDKRDRDFIRAALLASALALLFCYLKNRKSCKYSEPLSQEGAVYYDEDELGMVNGIISEMASDYRPSDLTPNPELAARFKRNREIAQAAQAENIKLVSDVMRRQQTKPTWTMVSLTPENSR